MPINIHGLPLPKLLQELMEQGRWKKPANVIALKQMTGSQFPEGFTFLNIDGMQRESRPVHLVEDKKLAKIYHLASSKSLGKPITNDEILDIDNSVCIAVNWSEEAICLDYRPSINNPRVVVSVCKEGQFTEWKVAAPDFPSFARLLSL